MYSGGIMEDFDFLMVLPVALGDAAAGVASARFRTRTLAAAQEHAATSGYVGSHGRRPALFPSTASPVDGHPSESAFESWAKDYVSFGAALAVYEAASVADDAAFVREEAWPLLRAVAEYAVARGEWTAKGFEYGLSMNRDESMPRVNDASFLSLAAMRAIEVALECHETLPAGWRDERAAKNWAKVLAAIRVPAQGELVLPFVGAEISNATPRTWALGNMQQLLAHGVPARLSAATLRATLQAEEALRQKWSAAHAANASHPAPICDGEYMSCPPMAHAAALLGDRGTSRMLLRRLATNQTLPPFNIISEYPCGDCKAGFGVYMTNAGSFLSTLYGLVGVRAKMGQSAEAWLIRNATLPEGWESLSFGRVVLGGSAYRLDAAHGARATLTPPSKWDDDGAAQAINPPKHPIPPQTTPPSWWKPHYEKLGVYDAGGPCESTPFWWPKDRRMYLMEGVCEGRHQIEVSHGDSKWNGYWGGPSSGPFCERTRPTLLAPRSIMYRNLTLRPCKQTGTATFALETWRRAM